MKKHLTPDEQTWQNMRDSLRTLKSRCASLERQNKRLLADEPLVAAEREIRRLEERVRDLEDRWEECEMLLRKQERNVA